MFRPVISEWMKIDAIKQTEEIVVEGIIVLWIVCRKPNKMYWNWYNVVKWRPDSPLQQTRSALLKHFWPRSSGFYVSVDVNRAGQ